MGRESLEGERRRGDGGEENGREKGVGNDEEEGSGEEKREEHGDQEEESLESPREASGGVFLGESHGGGQLQGRGMERTTRTMRVRDFDLTPLITNGFGTGKFSRTPLVKASTLPHTLLVPGPAPPITCIFFLKQLNANFLLSYFLIILFLFTLKKKIPGMWLFPVKTSTTSSCSSLFGL